MNQNNKLFISKTILDNAFASFYILILFNQIKSVDLLVRMRYLCIKFTFHACQICNEMKLVWESGLRTKMHKNINVT